MARDRPGPTPSCAPLPSDGLGSFRPRSAPLPAGLGFSGHTRVSPALFGSWLRRSALSVPRPGGSFRRPHSAYLGRAPPLWARTNGLSLGGAAVGRPGPIRGAGGQSGGGAARARARNGLGEVASRKTGEKEPRLCPVGAGGAVVRRLQLQLRCEGFLAGPSSPTSGALRRGRAAQRASVLSVEESLNSRMDGCQSAVPLATLCLHSGLSVEASCRRNTGSQASITIQALQACSMYQRGIMDHIASGQESHFIVKEEKEKESGRTLTTDGGQEGKTVAHRPEEERTSRRDIQLPVDPHLFIHTMML
uniref:uncharacterized protein LOC107000709 isoform X1 n=1 Tax=Macaca mulatta TaxID=9544 RepID=UPI0010A25128|nr:uncharacterized protein LOC107000709 isoform X1 [Macaca mulatta]